jgi:hypothetical protein
MPCRSMHVVTHMLCGMAVSPFFKSFLHYRTFWLFLVWGDYKIVFISLGQMPNVQHLEKFVLETVKFSSHQQCYESLRSQVWQHTPAIPALRRWRHEISSSRPFWATCQVSLSLSHTHTHSIYPSTHPGENDLSVGTYCFSTCFVTFNQLGKYWNKPCLSNIFLLSDFSL